MEEELFWRPSWVHKRSESHSRYLGILWANLHSLETALRIALCGMERVPDLQSRLHALFEAPVGQTVADDHFTKHNQLHDLIRIFNDIVGPTGIQIIEPDIGELRHALAHGRVTAVSNESDIRLINFKRVKGGDPVICYSAAMTPKWFKAQRKRVRDATTRVHAFSKTLPGRGGIITVGNVTNEDIARVLQSEDVSKARHVVIVGKDKSKGRLDELRDLATRMGGKVVLL